MEGKNIWVVIGVSAIVAVIATLIVLSLTGEISLSPASGTILVKNIAGINTEVYTKSGADNAINSANDQLVEGTIDAFNKLCKVVRTSSEDKTCDQFCTDISLKCMFGEAIGGKGGTMSFTTLISCSEISGNILRQADNSITDVDTACYCCPYT